MAKRSKEKRIKTQPRYMRVWLGLYCKPNAISPLCLMFQNTCRLDNLRITTNTCAQLQNTYKDRSTNFSRILRGCWVPWLLQSRHQIYCSSDKLFIRLKICCTCAVVNKSIYIIFCSLSFDMFLQKKRVMVMQVEWKHLFAHHLQELEWSEENAFLS